MIDPTIAPQPIFDDGQVSLYHGHVLEQLRALPAESVQCVVTSPPYWSIRAYGTDAQVWGGDADHAHIWGEHARFSQSSIRKTGGGGIHDQERQRWIHAETCACGAWRGELGHEPTPQLFVSHLVDVFREVYRVLRDDGLCFINIGDSYNAGTRAKRAPSPATDVGRWQVDAMGSARSHVPGGKAKDLVLIPERLAIALQDDGWYVRSRIAWCKRTPMPESVRDRFTQAWEHIWMLSKSRRYYWDAAAAKEATSGQAHPRGGGVNPKAKVPSGWDTGPGGHRARTGRYQNKQNESFSAAVTELVETRNMRNYWLLSADPEPGAHFATFPREIPRRCIAVATRPGDVVLDPFVGSGRTCEVARSVLRRSIGIDLNETYLREIAMKRTAQMALMPPK